MNINSKSFVIKLLGLIIVVAALGFVLSNPVSEEVSVTNENKPETNLEEEFDTSKFLYNPFNKLDVSEVVSTISTIEGKRGQNSGSVEFVSSEQYSITYNSREDTILISISGSPFSKIRNEAERELLSKLDITKAEACSLKLTITTPLFANPDYAGNEYGLSFCDN